MLDEFAPLPFVADLVCAEAGEPLRSRSAAAVLSSGRFDRVLGSVHTLPSGGRLIYARALLRREPAGALMRRYFAEVIAMIEGSDLFEVLAHLDYPRRYWPQAAGRFQETDFEEEYRASAAGAGFLRAGLELNTASPLLSVSVLRWWRDEGGWRCRSAATHLPGYVGGRFGEAVPAGGAGGRIPARPRSFRFLALLGLGRLPRAGGWFSWRSAAEVAVARQGARMKSRTSPGCAQAWRRRPPVLPAGCPGQGAHRGRADPHALLGGQ